MPKHNPIRSGLFDENRTEERKQIAAKLLNEGEHLDPESKMISGLTPEHRATLDEFIITGNLNAAVKKHFKYKSKSSVSHTARRIAHDVLSQAYVNRRVGPDGLMPKILERAEKQLDAEKAMKGKGGEIVFVPDNRARNEAVKNLLDHHLKSVESLRKAQLLEAQQQQEVVNITARLVEEKSTDELRDMVKQINAADG